MNIEQLSQYDRTGRLDALVTDSQSDPRVLHDVLRGVVSGIEASQHRVPADLRRALEDLEADIAETYFNNVPV